MSDVAKGMDVSKKGNVTGKIECEDKELKFGFIKFFPKSGRVPDPSRFWTTTETIFPLDAEGKFDVSIREGSYYIIAVKRQRKDISDMEPGDCLFFNSGSAGPIAIDVKENMHLDLGVKKGASYVLREESGKDRTVVRGFIRGEDNMPVPGIMVLAFSKESFISIPDFISSASGKDGRYELRFPEGGSYFLAAASRLGGPPSYGDYYGVPDTNPLTVKSGESTQIDIRVRKMQ